MISGARRLFEARVRERGYTLEEVRGCIVDEAGDQITVDADHSSYPRAMNPRFLANARIQSRPTTSGPGTELKAILKGWLGIEPTEGCSCNSMAARMDALGPDWCESDAGMAEILVVMREEAAKRGLPFLDAAGRLLVRRAIKNARRAIKSLIDP